MNSIIMESVLNIEPDDLTIRSIKEDERYSFLDFIQYNIKKENYYNLLNTLDMFKLKNIYRYLYLRTYKINERSGGKIPPLPKIVGKITGEELNRYLNEYINLKKESTLIHGIIIMNGIQMYFFPLINLS